MDPQQAEFLGSFWDTDRNVASQDTNDMFPFNNVFDFATVHNNVEGFGIQRQFRLTPENSSAPIRAPLPSPTSLPPPHGLFPSVLQPFKPSLMLSNYAGNSMATSAAYSAILRPPVRSPLPHFGFMEESPSSTDATPESSDVEEDNRVTRKKKRAKTLLNEEQASKHSEEAQRFPSFLQELRTRLVSESPDSRVLETTAVSALIQAFTRVNDEDSRFTLPSHCEQWLRQASESVQERRQMNKGMRKKRSSDAIIGTGPNERFFCQLCSEHDIKGFKTQEGLNLHIRNKHEADKQWKCFAPGCTVSFVRQADLRMHLIRMHSPQRPFPCKVPFCLKAFAGVSELRRHVKVDHRTIVQHLCGLSPQASNGNAEA